ncbi:hypothetical protein [Paenibacillus arenosi]|uniref:Uncharacterized protein n=1 Tax=Paenibacillus arenosi TaxID=2774142 RepID=A0ABR9B3M0_9BACL|nr:hypothetical protein [Paenibacillus arenosi]MBD8500968.1 hypothetical protein [Paenibacillus arenosi]
MPLTLPICLEGWESSVGAAYYFHCCFPDSGQYGSNFAIYALELIGYRAILTWLLFHLK